MAWLRRELWGSRPRRIISVVVAVVAVLVAAGGIAAALSGSSSPSPSLAATPESTATTPEPSQQEASCTTGPAAHNMRATFYGVGTEACTQLNQEVAKTRGEFWRVVPTGNYVEGSDLVCSMAKGSQLIEIRDTGEHAYGNEFCAGLTAKGWHEQEGSGEKAERERKVRQQKEKAEQEQRETEQHERETRQHEAERKKEEAKQKAENEKQEAESKKQNEESERQNREDLRKSEEETAKAQRESEGH
jgi:hypothetical protein